MSVESLLSACVALLILTLLMGIVLFVYSFSKQKKQQKYFEELHRALAPGKRIQFAGGLFGKLVRVGKESCDVELKSGEIVEVSRFAIQSVETK